MALAEALVLVEGRENDPHRCVVTKALPEQVISSLRLVSLGDASP